MKRMIKKLFILLLLCFIISGMFFFITKVFSYSFVQVFFTEIGPLNIIEGDVVHGNIEVDVSCGFPDDKVDADPAIDFGDGNTKHFEICSCDASNATTTIKNVNCNIHFTHIYNASGTYAVMPMASYGSGGGLASLGDLATGEIKIVRVVAPPTPGPATSTENPLATSTIPGVVNSISNFVVYVISGLALLLVMVGGFYIVTSSGSPEQMTKGKKIIVYTVIGYVLIMISRGVVNLILKITGVHVSI